MLFPIAKVAVGLGVIGGVSGLGYLSFWYFSSSDKKIPISQLFKKEGWTLLDKGGDEEQWKERWKAYVETGSDSWKLKDYETVKSNTNVVPNSFKDSCASNFQVEASGIDDPFYLEVVKNCSKKFKISELISSNSKITSLNTSDGQEQEWKGAWKNYLSDNGDNNPWDIENWETVKKQKEQLPTDFRGKCKSKEGEQVFGEKDSAFSRFVRWCAQVSV